MNKIKVLYDVFKTMKSMEAFKGEFKLETEKDKATVMSLTNEFEVNISNGNGKVKLESDLDCCGNKVKHESNTEFDLKDCCESNELWKKICGNNEGLKCRGLKGYLNRITFLLRLLNKINLKELEDGAVLTLDLKEFCKEACPECSKEACCEDSSKCCCGYDCFKEFLNCDYDEIMLTIWINNNSKIEKLEAEANASDRRIKALLNLNW